MRSSCPDERSEISVEPGSMPCPFPVRPPLVAPDAIVLDPATIRRFRTPSAGLSEPQRHRMGCLPVLLGTGAAHVYGRCSARIAHLRGDGPVPQRLPPS